MAATTATRPTVTSPTLVGAIVRLVARQAGRTAAIMLAAAVVTGATIMIASAFQGAAATGITASGPGRQAGPPREFQQANPDQAVQPGRLGGSGQSEQGVGPRREGGFPGGRTTPNLQRGLPDLLRYTAIMATATAAVVLVLHLRRRRKLRHRQAT
ncbi:MAG: hypothetical protein U0821_05985 [Chloroflexota bacterium]